MSRAVRCLSMTKGPHRFVFRCPVGREMDLLASLVALAEDAESDFDWFDAAVLSYQMGQRLARDCDAVALPE